MNHTTLSEQSISKLGLSSKSLFTSKTSHPKETDWTSIEITTMWIYTLAYSTPLLHMWPTQGRRNLWSRWLLRLPGVLHSCELFVGFIQNKHPIQWSLEHPVLCNNYSIILTNCEFHCVIITITKFEQFTCVINFLIFLDCRTKFKANGEWIHRKNVKHVV